MEKEAEMKDFSKYIAIYDWINLLIPTFYGYVYEVRREFIGNRDICSLHKIIFNII